jgi:PAB1-binding protein PBP1
VQTVKKILLKVLRGNEFGVESKLMEAIAAYNATPHSSTGYSPFFIAHMRPYRSPLSLALTSPIKSTVKEYVDKQSPIQVDTELKVQQNLAQRDLQQDVALLKNKVVDPNSELNVGDLVWLEDPTANRVFHHRLGRGKLWLSL